MSSGPSTMTGTRCTGDCGACRGTQTAGIIQEAGKSAIRFLWSAGIVERVQCTCAHRCLETEERGVVGLLHDVKLLSVEDGEGSMVPDGKDSAVPHYATDMLRLSALSLGFNIAESTHCSNGAFHRRADSTLVPTSMHSTRAAIDAMDASVLDSVPVVYRRKTGGRCHSRPRGASEASDSFATAALACLVAFSLMGQAHAAYSCSTKADCNYDGCANVACSSSSSSCNNGVWVHSCVSTL